MVQLERGLVVLVTIGSALLAEGFVQPACTRPALWRALSSSSSHVAAFGARCRVQELADGSQAVARLHSQQQQHPACRSRSALTMSADPSLQQGSRKPLRSRFVQLLERIVPGGAAALSALQRRLKGKAVTVMLALCLLMPGLMAPRTASAEHSSSNSPIVMQQQARRPQQQTLQQQQHRRTRLGASAMAGGQQQHSGHRAVLVSAQGSPAQGRTSAQPRPAGTQPVRTTAAATAAKKSKRSAFDFTGSSSSNSESNMGGRVATAVVENALEIGTEFEHHLNGAKRDTLLLLMAVALVIPLSKRAGLSPILGFLATGELSLHIQPITVVSFSTRATCAAVVM
jgi:hypothetical protein